MINVAIIPARGGSKRIPRKNIRPFCGKPMIAWPIEALRASGTVQRIVVSTDDDEIAAVAAAHGAEVPFRRPAALANDHAATLPVIAHAVAQLQAQGWVLARVCCVYATAPLLDAQDLLEARELLDRAGVQYVFSGTTFPFPIQRALRRDASGAIEPMFPQSIEQRSQDLPEALHDAGQFYWGRPEAFARQLPIFAPHSRIHLLPRHRVQDIDIEEDWQRAEALHRALRSS
jgi:pseudaminic acid cytidylyltransferase